MAVWGPLRLRRRGHSITVAATRLGALQVARTRWGRDRLELKAVRTRWATADPLWSDHVVAVHGPGVVLVSSWVDLDDTPEHVTHLFLRRQLRRIDGAPMAPVVHLLDWARLRDEWLSVGVAPSVVDIFQERLTRCTLPVSSTHGDLHGGNVGLRRDGSVGVVDWETYSPRSSLLLDVVNYEVEALRRAMGVPWEQTLRQVRHRELVREAAARWQVPVQDLMLAYVAFRLGRHTWILDGVCAAPARKVERHVDTLSRAAEVFAPE